MKQARILLADDHTLILEGFRTVLAEHHDIVGAVMDGASLIEAAIRLKPDLIILDIAMPNLNGIQAAGQIRKILPETKLLFVTMHSSPTYLQAALHVGGAGFVLKSSAREEIVAAVEKVLKGQTYITPGVVRESMETIHNLTETGAAAATRLTTREREILKSIAEGRSNKEVAFLLHLSIKTISFHRENIKRKVGLRSTAELTKYAIEEGLI